MSKIAIITDSTAYLNKDEIEKLNIHVLPLTILFEDHVYTEGEDITPSEFYELIRGAKELPKSSQPTVGKTVELFEQLSTEYDAAIAIHLSSDISGTYQTSTTLSDEFSPFKVYTVDSRRSCGAQAQLVREAVRLANHTDLSAQEIVTCLESMIEKQSAYFLVDDLNNLQKGGRLSKGAAVVGSMLSIKPLLTINGPITAQEKIRTFKKGLSRVVDLCVEHLSQLDEPIVATIHYANNTDVADQLETMLKEKLPSVEINRAEFGPVIGTHLGEGAAGIAFGPKQSN